MSGLPLLGSEGEAFVWSIMYHYPMRTTSNFTLIGQWLSVSGGGGGIRTHGTLSRTPVFKTGAFDHSATPPVEPS